MNYKYKIIGFFFFKLFFSFDVAWSNLVTIWVIYDIIWTNICGYCSKLVDATFENHSK